jgi:hypothetical protein
MKPALLVRAFFLSILVVGLWHFGSRHLWHTAAPHRTQPIEPAASASPSVDSIGAPDGNQAVQAPNQ